jgi:hypothetical protein
VIDVLIPTVGRADRLAAVAANVHEATVTPHRVVFIVEEHDKASCAAVADMVPADSGLINLHGPTYAGAILTGYQQTDGEFLFAGADDLRFHPGWDLAALAVNAQVVGTNDLCNPFVGAGTHATHYLVHRHYLDTVGGVIDQGPGSFLNTIYDHQYTDTEFVGTAIHRGVFAPCMESIVEHLHWSTGKSDPDATTVKTNARISEDEELFRSRRHLWAFADCHQEMAV